MKDAKAPVFQAPGVFKRHYYQLRANPGETPAEILGNFMCVPLDDDYKKCVLIQKAPGSLFEELLRLRRERLEAEPPQQGMPTAFLASGLEPALHQDEQAGATGFSESKTA